jgi:hypothetical protein
MRIFTGVETSNLTQWNVSKGINNRINFPVCDGTGFICIHSHVAPSGSQFYSSVKVCGVTNSIDDTAIGTHKNAIEYKK